MYRGRKRRILSISDSLNNDTTMDMNSGPHTKRCKLSILEPEPGLVSDDNTLSTVSHQTVLTPSPHFDHSNIKPQSNEWDNSDANMIDLGVEFPSLPQVLNTQQIDELALDSTFDFAQFTRKQNDAKNEEFPIIFNWEELIHATDPQELRTEALRKQERGKYVRRDSLSSEQAADRRRRQNRESARRTRNRVRKYITVLEMYYSHVQKVNALLIKQLEVMAKHCSKQLTDDERAKLKMYSWPKPPTIEECMKAKPATISATSSTKKSPPQSPQHNSNHEHAASPHGLNQSRHKGSDTLETLRPQFESDKMALAFENVPTLSLSSSCNAYNNNHKQNNGPKTSQINIMQMNHNNMNILNQIQAINTFNNNIVRNNHVMNRVQNPLEPFERELLQCGVSLNPMNIVNNNNTQYVLRPMMSPINGGNVLTLQAVPTNNVLALHNVLPTQLHSNTVNNLNRMNRNGSM